MIRVGIAGIGFMGWVHWQAYQRVSGIEVAAIATRDQAKRLGDWRSIKGNFGGPGEFVNLNRVAVYETLEQMLSNSELDCIDICLPPNMHVDAAMKSAGAGKHVFCEKPLALDVAGCDSILTSCSASGVQLLVGQVLPFFPEYRWAREQIDSGHYGRLIGGHFKRVISNPEWIPDFYDPTRIGGPLIDLHVHDAHLIRLMFGMPRGLYCRGRMNGDCVEFASTVFDFPDPDIVVSAMMGVTRQPGRSFTHGFEIHLERATIHFEFAGFADQPETMPVKLIDVQGGVIRPQLGGFDPVDGFVGEIEDVRQSISTHQPSRLLAGELARDAIAICQHQAASVRLNQYVEIAR